MSTIHRCDRCGHEQAYALKKVLIKEDVQIVGELCATCIGDLKKFVKGEEFMDVAIPEKIEPKEEKRHAILAIREPVTGKLLYQQHIYI